MTPDKYSEQLEETIEKSVKKLTEQTTISQRQMYDEIVKIVTELDTESGTVRQTVKNYKVVTKIKALIEKIIQKGEYRKSVNDFVETINEITNIQTTYFKSLDQSFKKNELMNEIRKTSIDSIYESLTGAGINSVITEKVQDILRKNMTTGAKYFDVVSQVKEYLTNTESGLGALERYAGQIANDSLNQYSAQYTQLTTDDLGLEWYVYKGALIKTSREFCEACKKKKYIHKSEFQNLIEGNFKEFKEVGGKIYDKTGLPDGMIAGTNASNFSIYRGGYNCNHQLVPVSKFLVPKNIRDEINVKILS